MREALSSSSPSFWDYCQEKRERLMENSQGLHAEETALVETPHLSSGPPGAASSCGRHVLVAPRHAMLTQLGWCVWHPLHAKLCATLSTGSGDRVKNQEMGPDPRGCGRKQGSWSSFPTHCKGSEQRSRAVTLPLTHTHTFNTGTHATHMDTHRQTHMGYFLCIQCKYLI